MIPYTLVLEPGLIIQKIYMGYWFFGRPTLEDLRHDLRAVLKKCRPDWDISTPELKARGRKAGRSISILMERAMRKPSANRSRISHTWRPLTIPSDEPRGSPPGKVVVWHVGFPLGHALTQRQLATYFKLSRLFVHHADVSHAGLSRGSALD